MKILIADDEAPARDKLRRWLQEADGRNDIVEASNGVQAFELIQQQQPDLALLDIHMPQLNGLDVAAQLDGPNAPRVVFVTAYDEHAVKAFELNAVDYLLKPYDKTRFLRMWQRVNDQVAAPPTATQLPLQRLLIPQKEKLLLVDIENIVWIESDDNHVKLHCIDTSHSLRKPLHDLLQLLPPQQFIRVHKSAAVNLLHIAQMAPLFKGDYEITLKNGQTLRMSRRYKDDVFAKLG